MKMILIAVVALLVLGGGGAGAYFYFVKPAEASVDQNAPVEDAKHKPEKEKKAESGGHGGGGHGEGVAFVALDPLILPIVDKTGVTQVLSIIVALEVPNPEIKAEVEAETPRLKDAYIREMYGMMGKQAAMKGGVIQASYLKEKLNSITSEVMGEDKVTDVLLQVIEQRPM